LEQHHDELKNAGLEVIPIGLGEPKHAERYCSKLAPSYNCLSSDSNDPYFIYGLQRGGFEAVFNRDLLVASAKALFAGHMNGRTTGDVGMMPGTFLVDCKGIIRYTYYSQHAGDHPDFSVLLETAGSIRSEI
jgi:peroxiredoxin